MFKYSEEDGAYLAELSGVEFICEEPSGELEEQARELADLYEDRLIALAEFILEEMETDGLDFGPLTASGLIEALGKPQIDLDQSVLRYLEQTLDDHIFEVEFEGDLEEFLVFSIDG
ncbi:MAG: hypothetical protein K2L38_01880 [Dysosmobacter sp.]|nr:hypothetical protein [Dysosmobacter sp.]